MLEEIDIKRRDGIARVALDRPSARNAVTMTMWHELAEGKKASAISRQIRMAKIRSKPALKGAVDEACQV
jgi:enoyl-CoA hydratase/carnithine racemase